MPWYWVVLGVARWFGRTQCAFIWKLGGENWRFWPIPGIIWELRIHKKDSGLRVTSTLKRIFRTKESRDLSFNFIHWNLAGCITVEVDGNRVSTVFEVFDKIRCVEFRGDVTWNIHTGRGAIPWSSVERRVYYHIGKWDETWPTIVVYR